MNIRREGVGRVNPEANKSETQERRAKAILRYIEFRILSGVPEIDKEEVDDMRDYYKEQGARRNADALYGKLMAYIMDRKIKQHSKDDVNAKGDEFDENDFELDPFVINEIAVLMEDEDTKKMFSETYAEARTDIKTFNRSELANLWEQQKSELESVKERFIDLERDMHTGKVTGRGAKSSTKSRMARLSKKMDGIEQRQQSIENLSEVLHTPENTDVAALLRYEKLKEYKRQAEEGFVWLPSRLEIHKATVSAILNHRWPVLIGEAGTGKSEQADAAAVELTGEDPLEIECSSTTGYNELVGKDELDPETGGSYEDYGPLMQAYTGYSDSRQKKTSVKSGRIARFDESGRMGIKAYAVIKKARQKRAGDDFHGREVLPGAGAIWTTNPVGPRYPDRKSPDPAMRRELAEITVSYPELSTDNPELFEFLIATLFTEDSHINSTNKEMAPAYDLVEMPAEDQEILEDGRTVVAKEQLITDPTDLRHGALWRFANSIHALQESFVAGNTQGGTLPTDILRYKEGADGPEIVVSGGEPLTLASSTVTLGELSSWMQGFDERMEKSDVEFHTETLTEWLDFKAQTYLKQVDEIDRDKVEAIFRHFGILDPAVEGIKSATPITPKEIGYLSPRVPRALHLKEAEPIKAPEKKEIAEGVEAEEYITKEVVLENGNKVLIQEVDYNNPESGYSVVVGKKIVIEGDTLVFAGVIDDEKSADNGKMIFKLNEEELFRVLEISENEIMRGVTMYEAREIVELMGDEFTDEVRLTWANSCENNEVNNTEKIAQPQW